MDLESIKFTVGYKFRWKIFQKRSIEIIYVMQQAIQYKKYLKDNIKKV